MPRYGRRLVVVLGVVLIAAAISPSDGFSLGMEPRPTSQTSVQDDQRGARGATTKVTDPEDVGACDTAPDCPIDIRAVSKRPFRTATGRRMLAFSVNAYELHGGLVFVANIKLRLDTRDDQRSDAEIFMGLTELAQSIGWACGRRYSFGDFGHRYRIKRRGDRLTCYVPRSDLHQTKRIRFQALSRGNEFVVDRAPDHGWGGG
jgi:hypothetical protein